jgi:DNA-binding SARP family transcriptional activator
MEFRILGPLSVVTEAGTVEVRGHRVRSLLALLLLNANEVVPSSRLLAECWPSDVLRSADNALEAQIKRLRAKLDEWEPSGPGRHRLLTKYRGYQLTVAPQELDVLRFRALRLQGRAMLTTDLSGAVVALRTALALWQGSVLSGVESPSCENAVTRLDQSRTCVREEVVQAELKLGRHRDVIDELQELVLVYPLQECFYDMLMIALYRCGFVSDALNTYRRARRVFQSELGIEPSRLLRRRLEMILRNDASLLPVAS